MIFFLSLHRYFFNNSNRQNNEASANINVYFYKNSQFEIKQTLREMNSGFVDLGLDVWSDEQVQQTAVCKILL